MKVFYIGKGQAKRAYVHLRPSMRKQPSPKNTLLNSILAEGFEPIIRFIYLDLTEQDALNKEMETIALYGKHNLTNRTTGGQGCSGLPGTFLGKTHSAEAREKIRQSKLGHLNPNFGKTRTAQSMQKFKDSVTGDKHHNYGKKTSEQIKEKISKALKGLVLTEEQKEQRRVSMKKVWAERKAKKLAEQS